MMPMNSKKSFTGYGTQMTPRKPGIVIVQLSLDICELTVTKQFMEINSLENSNKKIRTLNCPDFLISK